MSGSSFLCETHHNEASHFCLCQPNLLHLCSTCIAKHQAHEFYPIAQLELFQSLHRDKVELKRRNEIVQRFEAFLAKVGEREAATQMEARILITSVLQRYETWLEKNYRCFLSLLEALREETALLLTSPEYRASTLSQLLQQSPLNSEDEKKFVNIPEIDVLLTLSEHCKQTCSRTQRVWQSEYDEEVLQAFSQNTSTRTIEWLEEDFTRLNQDLEVKLTDFKQKAQHQITTVQAMMTEIVRASKDIEGRTITELQELSGYMQTALTESQATLDAVERMKSSREESIKSFKMQIMHAELQIAEDRNRSSDYLNTLREQGINYIREQSVAAITQMNQQQASLKTDFASLRQALSQR